MHLAHNHGNQDILDFEHMPKTDDFEVVSDIFKMLSDSSRIRIFWVLCHCEECVMNISSMMEMSSPAVSHHLKLLKDCGLVESRRDGKEVYYKAAQNHQATLLHKAIEEMVEVSCLDFKGHTKNTETIKKIHDCLTTNLDKRYTIEELAKEYLINASTLKQVFKSVYGKPIASYMKEYRITRAKELLRETNDSVLEIAIQLGYQSQSRFSEAFRDYTGMLPTDFRKREHR